MSLHVVGIGEVLWDLLPTGKRLGGAPANFACHAQALGARASIVTAVGADNLGQEIVAALENRGFLTNTVSCHPSYPTGTVTVQMDTHGHPSYTIHEDVAWDHLRPNAAAQEAVQNADAIGFGTVSRRHQDSRAAISELLHSAPRNALKVLDVK